RGGELRELGLAPFGLQPAAHALLLHRHGEGLVERGVVTNISHLVGELVEEEPRELRIRIDDERGKQRIVEPAERRVSRHPPDMHVVAFGTQTCGVALRELLGEEAAIAYTAGE